MSDTFQNLGLVPELINTVTELDYIKPTPIQVEAIPLLLDGQDVMGQAQTGTGKTAAFTLPLLQRLHSDKLQALILAPTRELAIQVAEAVYRYGNKLGVRVLPVYGGQSYSRQIRRLKKGVQVVVGTPGRTLDLIQKGELDLSHVHFLVLDEADEMLKMGFIEDVEAILSATHADDRQTVIVSATLSKPIQKLARQYMHDPQRIIIESETITLDNIAQRYYIVNDKDKVPALSRLLEVEDLRNTLIFTRTKVGAVELSETLTTRGYHAESIQGDLPQAERERILRRFRNGQCSILVATDVVARGIDIPDVSHIINFDLPQRGEEYVHRIGRTGRAGREGDAISFITPRQKKHMAMIEQFIQKPIRKATLPSRDDVLRRRAEKLMQQLLDQMTTQSAETEFALLEKLLDMGYALEQVAAAAIQRLRVHEIQRPLEDIAEPRNTAKRRHDKPRRRKRDHNGHEPGMVRLYMDIGKKDGVRPGDIVYGIASQANIPGSTIGAIKILTHETYLDVHESSVDAVLRTMGHGKIRGRSMTLARADDLFEMPPQKRRNRRRPAPEMGRA